MNIALSAKKILGFIGKSLNLIEVISKSPSKSFVLGYHRVIPKNSSQEFFCVPGMYVTPDTFRCHLKFLLKRYKIVHLKDLVNSSSTEMRCAITFDDGWFDNYSFAYPILKELDIPATIFLTTGFIETQKWPWPDRLMFYSCRSTETDVLRVLNECISSLPFEPRFLSLNSLSDLIAAIKDLAHADVMQIMKLVDEIFSDYHTELHTDKPALSWDNIREMSAHSIDFGFHSDSHLIANKMTLTSLLDLDYNISANIFQSKLGYAPELFAYPNGDYNSDVIEILSKMHVKIAVTTNPGFFNGKSPLAVNRILVHDDISSNDDLFAFRLLSSVISSNFRQC